MIPIVLPIAVVLLTFLAITAAAYIVFIGADGLLGYARRIMPGVSGQQVALEGAGPGVAISFSVIATPPRVEGYSLPESLYYHQGHAWVALQEDGQAVVGVDDFAGKLIGKLTSIVLPKVGQRCRQGAKGWSLHQSEKSLDMLFPLDGEVVAVNESVQKDPSKLSEEPYGCGWLMKIKPKDLTSNLRNLLRGSAAKSWMENSAVELRSALSGDLGVVFQDGGLPQQGLADQFSTEDWVDLTTRIFLIEPENTGM
jgi:glycine cleavage system H protein